MAELIISFDLSVYLTALGTRLRDNFSDHFNSIILYPVRDDMSEARFSKIAQPALLIDMYEAEPVQSEDIRTEQLSVNLLFSAHLLYPMDYANLHPVIRAKSLEVAQFIYKQYKFDLPIGESVIENIMVDDNVGDQSDRFYAWMIEWSHVAVLSDSVYDVENFKPTESFYSFHPNIGPEHLDDYIQVLDG